MDLVRQVTMLIRKEFDRPFGFSEQIRQNGVNELELVRTLVN